MLQPDSLRTSGILALCLGGWVLTSSALATPSLENKLKQCTDRLLANKEFSAYETVVLKKACPELKGLTNHPIVRNLSPKPKGKLSLTQLLDIQHHLLSQHPANNRTKRLDISQINAIIKQSYTKTDSQEEEEVSWQKQFLDWLNSFFGQDEESMEDSWLFKLLEKINIPEEVGNIIFKGLIILLIGLALLVLFNELRNAGILNRLQSKRRGKTKRILKSLIRKQNSTTYTSIADIRKLQGREQIRALLNFVLTKLETLKLLPAKRSLTNQEYANLLRKRVPDLGSAFGEFVRNTDRALYGSDSNHYETEYLFNFAEKLQQQRKSS